MRKGFIGMMAAALALGTCMTAQASEVGVITAMSEKVYLESREDATVLENILQGTSVEVILSVTDEAGAVWYYVRTTAGLEGYMPADSVSLVQTQDEQAVQETQQSASEQQETGEQQQNTQSTDTAGQTVSTTLTATDNVNIRALPDATSTQLGNITRGTEVEYTAAYTNEAGELWYAVTYLGTEGYVIGTAVDAGEYPPEPQPWSETVSQEPEQTDNGTDTEQAGDADAQENAAQTITEPETATAAEQTETTATAQTEAAGTTSAAEEAIQSAYITPSSDDDTMQTTKRTHRIELFEVLLVAAVLLCVAAIVLLIKKIRELLIYKETRNERKQANAKRRK